MCIAMASGAFISNDGPGQSVKLTDHSDLSVSVSVAGSPLPETSDGFKPSVKPPNKPPTDEKAFPKTNSPPLPPDSVDAFHN